MMNQVRSLVRLVLAIVASTVALLLVASPALAAVNESFEVFTTNGCGSIEFVDYGTMNGSANDDFFLVHDYCADGHGVRGYLKATLLDGNGNPEVHNYSRYNGNGYAGPPEEWDPVGNLTPGEYFEMRVCLVDGPSDPTPFRCSGWWEHSMVDG